LRKTHRRRCFGRTSFEVGHENDLPVRTARPGDQRRLVYFGELLHVSPCLGQCEMAATTSTRCLTRRQRAPFPCGLVMNLRAIQSAKLGDLRRSERWGRFSRFWRQDTVGKSSVSVLSVSAKPASSPKVTLRVIAGNSALDMVFKV